MDTGNSQNILPVVPSTTPLDDLLRESKRLRAISEQLIRQSRKLRARYRLIEQRYSSQHRGPELDPPSINPITLKED